MDERQKIIVHLFNVMFYFRNERKAGNVINVAAHCNLCVPTEGTEGFCDLFLSKLTVTKITSGFKTLQKGTLG